MQARRRPSDLAERRLAERLRRREADALAEAYRLYGAATFGLLLRLLQDRGAAEDVQQQVFLEVWRRADVYDPARGSLVTWILTIARSRGIDHLRRPVPEPLVPGTASEAAQEADADALLERARLGYLLQRLPAEERAVLRLRFYDDLSQAQISEATGVPLGTVKTRMVRGLTRLREMIQAEEA